MKKQLRVMKFGGTSVGEASCIGKVVDIIRAAARESSLVVVVSAMSGVTNKLIEAATRSEAGDGRAVAAIFKELREQHEAAVTALIHSPEERRIVRRKIERLIQEGGGLCQDTNQLRQLTPWARDSISSLGERLSVFLVAAAVADRGVATEAIEATELVVTNSWHGAADPLMGPTRERCNRRLRPLLQQGIVPVVTGFIGATADGVLTTLGRGGSDYSATILGASLEANEVIIWTDVDGLMTADPRVVPTACTIPEISNREAAALAHFGAKVLHPKTLHAAMPCGIPVWIRNTFAPERSGTRITPAGPPESEEVKALSAISDVAMITIGGPAIIEAPDVLERILATAASVRTDVLMVSQSPLRNDVCLVVSASLARSSVEALRREFGQDLACKNVERITLDPSLALVTMVGRLCGINGTAGRTVAALGRDHVNILAIGQGSSECNISLVVEQKDMRTALVSLHREFQLGRPEFASVPRKEPADRPTTFVLRA